MKRHSVSLILFLSFLNVAIAQKDSVVCLKDAIDKNRQTQFQNIVKNIINKNLQLPLNENTESNWEDAFWAIELTHYKFSSINKSIATAFAYSTHASGEFNRSLLEFVYVNDSIQYKKEMLLFLSSNNAQLFAISAAYFKRILTVTAYKKLVYPKAMAINKKDSGNAIIQCLLNEFQSDSAKNYLEDIFSKDYLPNEIVMFSLQRKNRAYPGLVLVRNAQGNFIKNDSGEIFNVPQLAMSVSNLPSYLSKGNTPQGIFNMNGFDVSKAKYIGPTPNVQLQMPYEISVQNFLHDSAIVDTVWTEELYKKLLPQHCKNYFPLFQSYYASKAGRTAIIAHGTTVNPDYYTGTTYYPHTPTEGCLCAMEIWNNKTGCLQQSNQQQLVNALKKAGGAHGYCVVLELNDEQKRVTIEEVQQYLH